MATKKKETVEVEESHNNDYGINAKFTWSYKRKGERTEEMVVVRSNDADDVLKQRQYFLNLFVEPPKTPQAQPEEEQKIEAVKPPPQQETKPISETKDKPVYMHEGDECLKCATGFMAVKNYKKDGQDRQFLACSNYPGCRFTALISKYPAKAKAS